MLRELMSPKQLDARERAVWRMRIVTTVASTLTTAILIWAGTSLLRAERDRPVIMSQLEGIQIQLSGVRTEKDAKRDIGQIIDRLKRNEDLDLAQSARLDLEDLKIEAHERRVRALELLNAKKLKAEKYQ